MARSSSELVQTEKIEAENEDYPNDDPNDPNDSLNNSDAMYKTVVEFNNFETYQDYFKKF